MFHVERTDPEAWDSIVFTVQWPITTCLKWKESRPAHTCILPDKHRWTIHGVWPTRTGTEGPSFCNRTWTFDPNQVEELKPDLYRLWPNIHGEDTVDSLWKHEWEKHGTCAVLHPQLASEQLYFNQGLNWVKKYHMHQILTDKHIYPTMSALYNATTVWQALRDAIGFDPSIACELDKDTGVTYLSEIRLCFHKDLSLINCRSQHISPHIQSRVKSLFQTMSLTNCPIHKLISYPGNVPPAKPKIYVNKAHRFRSVQVPRRTGKILRLTGQIPPP